MSADSGDGGGFKRPPTKSQFKKGVSGNPRGRPKGTRNFKTDLKETLAQPVQVTEHGRSRSMSTQRAGLERLREKALRGDPRALDSMLELAERHGDDEAARDAERKFSQAETEILADYHARVREQLIAELAAAAGAAAEPGGADTAEGPSVEPANPDGASS